VIILLVGILVIAFVAMAIWLSVFSDPDITSRRGPSSFRRRFVPGRRDTDDTRDRADGPGRPASGRDARRGAPPDAREHGTESRDSEDLA
jgi:hypothetical protein